MKTVLIILSLAVGAFCDTFDEHELFIVKQEYFTIPKCVEAISCEHNQCKEPNMVYSDCTSACPPRCDDDGTELACAAVCMPGCACKEGYMLESKKSSKCVASCPKKQCKDKNREFTECGSACPIACDSPKDEACTDNCVEGCFCKQGFILESVNSTKCVESCPTTKPEEPECPDNMEFNTCVQCPKTCEDDKPQLCTMMCNEGCQCKKGFIFDNKKSKNCVPEETCTKIKECKAQNKVYTNCGSACPQACDAPKGRICMTLCKEGCVCPAGQMLESVNSKKCVSKCPKKPEENKCGENMEFVEAVGCPQSCTDPEPKMCKMMAAPGCQCKKGFIYENDKFINCIPVGHCPK